MLQCCTTHTNHITVIHKPASITEPAINGNEACAAAMHAPCRIIWGTTWSRPCADDNDATLCASLREARAFTSLMCDWERMCLYILSARLDTETWSGHTLQLQPVLVISKRSSPSSSRCSSYWATSVTLCASCCAFVKKDAC